MRESKVAAVTGVLALALIAAPGCVTKKAYKSNVEATDGRITSVESEVESQGHEIDLLKQETDRRIGTVQQDAQEAYDKAATAERGKLLWSVTMADDKIKFPFGEATLSEQAQQVLDDLVARVKSYGKALYIEVEGHTDDVGAEGSNLTLSEMRAEAVRNYLNKAGGIPLHAMNTIALGETQPVADNTAEDGRAANRRVVIRVLE